MIQYKGIQFDMVRAHGYGQYRIIGNVGTIKIDIHDTDSIAYDYLHDESDEEKRQAALVHCYNKIKRECKSGKYYAQYFDEANDCGYEFD